jgi:hypothetical protein
MFKKLLSRLITQTAAHTANGIAAVSTILAATLAVPFPPASIAFGIIAGVSWGAGVLIQHRLDKKKKMEKAMLQESLSSRKSIAKMHEISGRFQYILTHPVEKNVANAPGVRYSRQR